MRIGRGTCMAVAAFVGLVGAGCSTSESHGLCRRSNGAEVCLHGDGNAYELVGSGFRAHSELAFTMGGDGLRPMMVAIDDRGTTSQAGVTGVMAGPVEQRVTVSGMSAGGVGTTFDFVVPATR